jgi:hypothetical protein
LRSVDQLTRGLPKARLGVGLADVDDDGRAGPDRVSRPLVQFAAETGLRKRLFMIAKLRFVLA